MNLTPERKAEIDGMNVYTLLYGVRFSRIGDPKMQGEAGEYWRKRLGELRDKDPDAYVSASKTMGWEQ